MQPLRFEPFLRPMVWGGCRLGDVLHKPLPDEQPFGEAWEVSDHSLHNSVVAEGQFQGQSLRQLMEHHRAELLGAAAASHEIFPWLIKFLDANDWLSVQVHPDETAVKKLWAGENSKTEAWFILDVLPGSKIYAGLRDGVDEAALRAALQQGTVADCLHQFEPQPGDCVFLPAGTVHALGGGILLAEVQQTSDATFRLFDWNRTDAQGDSRKLHVEEAMNCIHWVNGPVQPVSVSEYYQSRERQVQLVTCPYFQMDFVETKKPTTFESESLQALIIARGQGRIVHGNSEIQASAGQVWLIPAACPSVRCIPEHELGIIVCTLP